jgi:hypothetical protein
MAFDKLVDSAALEANLKTVADAIREKAGTSDALAFPAGFAEAIGGISATEGLTAVLDEQEAKLEELLLAIALKSAGEGATIETWELTLTDGSVIEKRVVVI